MRKTKMIVRFIVVLGAFLMTLANNDASANETFSIGSYVYEIVSEPDDSGFGEVSLVGFDYKAKEFNPDGIVIYDGNKYILKNIALRKKTGLTENYSFSSLDKFVVPKEVKRIDNKFWSFGAEGINEDYNLRIILYCTPDAFSGIDSIEFGEQMYSTIISVPKDSLDEYNKLFSEKAFLFLHEPGDDYERKQWGFRVSEIGGEDKVSHFVYENNLYGIIDDSEHTAKLEALNFILYSFSEDIIRIPEKVYYKCEEYKVTTLASGGAVPAETPLIIPESVSKIEPRAIDGQCPAVYFPDSVLELPRELFAGENRWIQYIRLPQYLEIIPSGIFYYCKRLRYISVPASVKKIGSKAFGKNVNCIYMEGNIPHKFEKAIKSIKCAQIYTRGKYALSYEDRLKTKIEKGEIDVIECEFSYIDSLNLNYSELLIGQKKTYRLKETVKPNTSDYRMVWAHTNTVPAVNITLKGRFSYKWDKYYDSYKLYVYAIDVLTGKMAICPLIQQKEI